MAWRSNRLWRNRARSHRQPTRVTGPMPDLRQAGRLRLHDWRSHDISAKKRCRMTRIYTYGDGTMPEGKYVLASEYRSLETELAISKGREDGKQRSIEQLEASLRDALTRTSLETNPLDRSVTMAELQSDGG